MKTKLLTLITCIVFSSAYGQNKIYEISAVGFYNLENLFDTLDAPDIRDEEFTPKGKRVWNSDKYFKKLDNIAYTLSRVATEKASDGLSIIGVSEIENRSVLEDLVQHESLAARNYQIIHYDSPDERGIDVGLLYNPTHFEVIGSKAIPLLLYEEGERNFTRDILHVEGILNSDTIHVLVNHWPSRRGGEKRSSKSRKAAADICKRVYDSLLVENPNTKLVILGDLNDDPVNQSVKKHLVAKGSKSNVREGEMFNPMFDFYKKGIGSNAYRDAWSLFDQVILSEAWLDQTQNGLFYYQAHVYNETFLVEKEGKYKGYPKRTFSGDDFINGYSDHFPVFVYLLKEK